jgi:hypothetical protein
MDFISGQWLPRAPPYKVVRKPRPQQSAEQVLRPVPLDHIFGRPNST